MIREFEELEAEGAVQYEVKEGEEDEDIFGRGVKLLVGC